MKRIILLMLVVSILSCSIDNPVSIGDISNGPKALSDSRFNGDFTYFYYWIDSNGIEEITEYTSFDFDGTTKAWYYSKYKRYSKVTGWSYSGEYKGDAYSWYCEFEVDNGMYRTRLWDNSYSEWSEWENYSFSDDGLTLTLHNHYNIDGNDLIMTKDSDRSINMESRNISNYKIIKRKHYGLDK